ncbi:MAG: IPT/TIG domain-containing protein [Acidobacteriia bacterium]|nr:IPT/TIG domain-containing protein [Terriglobia bacterium]
MMLNHSGKTLWKAALLLGGAILVVTASAPGRAAQQATADVPPDATPEITAVHPNQGAPGQEVTVKVEGKNFSAGAYVSFSNPAVHAVSTERVSPTQLEARVAVGAKAQPGAISLFVSNPGSAVAEVPFSIVEETPASAPAAPPATTATPETQAPATAEASQQAPAAPGPEVKGIEPARAARGAQATLKITGKHFADGARVAFSNPGIQVQDVQVKKDTEIAARIQVAADAATGTTGMFVVNPDDTEAEVTFEVTGEATSTKASGASSAAPTAKPAGKPATKPAAKSAGQTLQFDVISLSDVGNILQSRSNPKGTLSLASGKLRFEESGKEVFSVPVAEIKEVGENLILGVNTGTFHILFASGQTYNFVAGSLRPADSKSIMESLQAALK